ncbi:polymer-forming cytoskeletal protein [bacterium]|nr:polymer-forming cytoskeletal protein [bacterium]MBU1074321.1 polymer-forming cytoskeletal protein [bacterium]MBU1676287.1 polymer-forming cytoskeletal protein [bacterium]
MSCIILQLASRRTPFRHRRVGSTSTLGLLLLLSALLSLAAPASAADETASSRGDSLRHSIERRLLRIGELRDSLSIQHEEEFTEAIEDLGQVFQELEEQLRDIDITIDDEMLKFSSPDGELRIDIPANWGERVSQGLSAITATILSELPDTLDIERGLQDFQRTAESWRIDILDEDEHCEPKLKIIGDEIFSTGDDVVVAAGERVAGSVVVLLGDATIMGTVDDNVVVIGGALNLGEDAHVHGDVVSLFGSLRRHDDATVGGTVVSIGGEGLAGDIVGLPDLAYGFTGVIIKLSGLLVLGLLILLVFALLPHGRLDATERYLTRTAGRSFAAGLLWATIGHMLLLLALALLILTVIGIPVAALLGIAYLLLGIISIGVVARVLGARLCQRFCSGDRAAWWTLLVGLLIILLPGILGTLFGGLAGFKPFGRLFELVSLAVHLTVYCFGSGAVLGSRFGSRAS